MFTTTFDDTVIAGEIITCDVDGFHVVAKIEADDDTTEPWKRED